MGKTSIEWTDASWNPITGCKEISPGCANCYAAKLASSRLKHTEAYKGLATDGKWNGIVRLNPTRMLEPVFWKKPKRIFVCDMADLFHEDVPDHWISQVFFTMSEAKWHTFQVLTKRTQRMRDWIRGFEENARKVNVPWPLPNVWIGTSVENQHFAHQRVPTLAETPAAVRFLSVEPMLSEIGLTDIYGKNYLREWVTPTNVRVPRAIDWVICGGESGANVRALRPDWVRALRDDCVRAGVPFFFKQWGTAVEQGCALPGHPWHEAGKLAGNGKKGGRILDGREWNEMPLSI